MDVGDVLRRFGRDARGTGRHLAGAGWPPISRAKQLFEGHAIVADELNGTPPGWIPGGTSARQAPLIGSGPDLALLPHLRGKPLATKLRPEPGAPPSDSERGRRGSFTPIATAGRGVNKDAVAAPSPQSTRGRYSKARRPCTSNVPGRPDRQKRPNGPPPPRGPKRATRRPISAGAVELRFHRPTRPAPGSGLLSAINPYIPWCLE